MHSAAAVAQREADTRLGIQSAKTNRSSSAPAPRGPPACKWFLFGNCSRGAACPFAHAAAAPTLPGDRGSTTSRSLLRRLLLPDIKKEQVYTLQCIQYLVQSGMTAPSVSRAAECLPPLIAEVEPPAAGEDKAPVDVEQT